jgi:hypothetical protein
VPRVILRGAPKKWWDEQAHQVFLLPVPDCGHSIFRCLFSYRRQIAGTNGPAGQPPGGRRRYPRIDKKFPANPVTGRGSLSVPLLDNATSRIFYDVGRFARAPSTPQAPAPNFAAIIMRENQVQHLGTNPASPLQVGVSFSDGFGREILKELQADPGLFVPNGPVSTPRWIGSSWTIWNKKERRGPANTNRSSLPPLIPNLQASLKSKLVFSSETGV